MRRHAYDALAALVIAAAVAGCSHELDGPEPGVSSAASPHLVCNQQLETPVDLMGSGFSPLPVETATGGQLLELPEITLAQTADLTGAATTGEAVTVPDDPENPESSQVRWHSQERMSFVVDEGLGLAEGVHQVRVTNPNGNEETFEDALVAVPPPRLDSVEPMAICVAEEAQVLEFLGEGFLDVGGSLPTVTFTSESDSSFSVTYTPDSLGDCMDLPAPATETQSCNSMAVTVPQEDLPPDTYSVVVTNPEPAACSSTSAISVDVVPPPTLDSISPVRICTGGGSIGLMGEGFREGATVTAGTVEAGSVNIDAGGMSGTAVFGPGLGEGVYDVTIENPEGCSDTLPEALEVIQGPILFFIDPPVVYSGISTQITLYVSGAGSGVDEVVIEPSGGGDPIALDASFDSARGRIQAIVPAGTTAGDYDVRVRAAGCDAVLPDGLTVTDELTLTVDEIDPAFGDDEDDTPVSLFGDGFVNTPRVYLNPELPAADTVATGLESVAFIDATRLTGVVPAGLTPGAYDVIVVNPSGEVGLLEGGYTVTAQDPPEIDVVLPGEVENEAPETVVAEGSSLDTVVSGEWECQLPDESVMAFEGPLGELTEETAEVTIDATGLPSGTVCVLRLFNADGAYGQYSAVAVTEPASNLAETVPSTMLTTARRAHALVSGRATRAARFLYAIGGDNGDPMMPHETSESAPVDVFGNLGEWFEQPNPLPTGLTYTDAWTIGRFIYLIGGSDGSSALSNVWRSKILDPETAPVITDIAPQQTDDEGLGAGVWYYRVSAVMADDDPENRGETLASDPLVIELPDNLPENLDITIHWSAVAGAEEYRVYRSPEPDLGPDSVQLIGTVPATEPLEFPDTGVEPIADEQPLPLGAHGTWVPMPSLNTPREAAGVGHAVDPEDDTIHYLYAVGGRNGMDGALATYEYLPIEVVDGDHTVDPTWIDGTETMADETAVTSTPMPRAELAVYSANRITASRTLSGGEAYIYAAGGMLDDGTTTRHAEAALVGTGGELGPFEDITGLIGDGHAGTAYATGNDFLYMFGGGPTPSDKAVSAEICRDDIACTGTAPEVVNWNAQGWTLEQERYQAAGTIESAHVFIVGGTEDGTTALATTETTVW
ncbi:MAG: hypothetical protein ACODAU_13425 [Myxococcota bacterium]